MIRSGEGPLHCADQGWKIGAGRLTIAEGTLATGTLVVDPTDALPRTRGLTEEAVQSAEAHRLRLDDSSGLAR